MAPPSTGKRGREGSGDSSLSSVSPEPRKKMNPSPSNETSSISLAESVTGSHRFKISNYSLTKEVNGVGKFISSSDFYVGGCGWRVDFYPMGDRIDSKDYFSIYLRLVTKESKAQVAFSFSLLDQTGRDRLRHKIVHSRLTMFENMNGSGWSKFMKRDDFEASDFLEDDSLCISCNVTVHREVRTVNLSACTRPPSHINRDIQNMYVSGIGADVKFDVNGEIFSAHKSILAARSSVFNALFFGNLKDEGSDPIKIEEMEASAFKVLLHFIYYDDLPEMDDDKELTPISKYGHILAAADRYDLNSLKLLCEFVLSKTLSINDVASIWVLAEKHNCSQLKLHCSNFVASLDNFQAVMETSDYKHIKEVDPSMAVDFFESVLSKKS